MMKNEENYNQAVALGLVENKPFHADNYSAVGFELMSTIVRKKLVINREIEIVEGRLVTNRRIKFKDYKWECPDPTLGG